MSYVNMQYTSPAWTNNAPPPLNATNLLDICHALEAVNITQDERSTLGAEATDKLGQVLQKIVQGTGSDIEEINSAISQLQEQMVEKGNCTIYSGSYVGNGQSTLTITFPQGASPKFLFVSSKNDSYILSSYSWVAGSEKFDIYAGEGQHGAAQKSGNKITFAYNQYSAFNYRNDVYYYVALG